MFARVTAFALGCLLTAPCALAQSELRDRLAAAVEAVEQACGSDIQAYCSQVSPREGRVLLCMQAYEDQLSVRCNFALYRVSRRLETALHRVERVADACWADIEARCGSAERVGQCLMQNKGSLSRACQTVFEAVQRTVRALASLRGMVVSSDDNKDVGRVLNVKRGPDGKVQALDVEVGHFLGLGDKVVTIDAIQLKEIADKIRLRIGSDQVRSLPSASGK